MKPVRFDGMNMRYVAPSGWDAEKDGKCGELPAFRDDLRQTVTSVWELDDHECDVIVLGGKIVLTVYGEQPPVMLEVRA